MNYAPMHYRKLTIAERGAFGQLPFYVRATAAMILKYCDDDGTFALAGKLPVDAVSRKCGAEPNERRALAAHIDKLIAVGYLHLEGDFLIVVEQANEAARIDAVRSSSRPSSSNTRASESATSSRRRRVSGEAVGSSQNQREPLPTRLGNELNARNHSADPSASEEIKKEREEESWSAAPTTSPSPSEAPNQKPMRCNKFEAVPLETAPKTLAVPETPIIVGPTPGNDPRLEQIRQKLMAMPKPMCFLAVVGAELSFYASVMSAGLPMDQLMAAIDDAAVKLGPKLRNVQRNDEQGMEDLERFVGGYINRARRDRYMRPAQDSSPSEVYVPRRGPMPKPIKFDSDL